jgi:hypothetical protein
MPAEQYDTSFAAERAWANFNEQAMAEEQFQFQEREGLPNRAHWIFKEPGGGLRQIMLSFESVE